MSDEPAPANVEPTQAHSDAATRWIIGRPTNVARQIDSLAKAFAVSEAAAVEKATKGMFTLEQFQQAAKTVQELNEQRDRLQSDLAASRELNKSLIAHASEVEGLANGARNNFSTELNPNGCELLDEALTKLRAALAAHRSNTEKP